MAKSRVPSPKDVVKVRRLPPIGSKVPIEATVTRHGRNGFDTADTITIRIPGYSVPITVTARHLLEGDDA